MMYLYTTCIQYELESNIRCKVELVRLQVFVVGGLDSGTVSLSFLWEESFWKMSRGQTLSYPLSFWPWRSLSIFLQ